jgi:serine/threonine protein kinase
MFAQPTDEAFARYASQAGLATADQLDEARQLQADAQKKGQLLTLGDALVLQGAITAAQKEIAAKKMQAQQAGGIKTLGTYKLLKKLGEGGMGAVYLAEDTNMLRKVALKVLPKKYAADPEFLTRFRREAKAAGKLNHVNIVSAFTVGEELGNHYYVMEYCEGEPLDRVLKREGTLAWDKAVEVTMQIARGLKHAHDHGFIHRDIKPANVFVASQAASTMGKGSLNGVCKILDMGLSKNIGESDQSFNTQTGMALGTPHYISPEQARGEKDVDGRTDIYSLGATLYHLLTGQTPFTGSTAAMIIMKHLTDQIPNPQDIREDIPDGVVMVVQKMMAKAAEDRYADCQELLEDLEKVLDGKTPSSAEFDPGKSSVAMRQVKRIASNEAADRMRRGRTGQHQPIGTKQHAPVADARESDARSGDRRQADRRGEPRGPNPKNKIYIAAGVAVMGVLVFLLALTSGGTKKPDGGGANVTPPKPGPEAVVIDKPATPPASGADDAWIASVQKMTPEKQIEAVQQRLRELDDKSARIANHALENGGVVFVHVSARNIAPLRGFPMLRSVWLNGGTATDLSPLAGMALTELNCDGRPVGDLSPLRGMKLTKLQMRGSKVTDLSILSAMPLKELSCDFVPQRDTAILKSIKTLEKINGLPVAEFWAQNPGVAAAGGVDEAWVASVQKMAPEKQIDAVTAKLAELNPGFDAEVKPTVENNKVTRLMISRRNKTVTNIAPVAALKDLKSLRLNYLRGVEDLSPLKGLGLTDLAVYGTSLSDLSPLRGMQLSGELACFETNIVDLSPLQGMPLTRIHMSKTSVKDLSPLAGMRLTLLHCDNSSVTDLSPLKGMPLKDLNCDFVPARDTAILKSITSLEKINTLPVAEFWANNGGAQRPPGVLVMEDFESLDLNRLPAEYVLTEECRPLISLVDQPGRGKVLRIARKGNDPHYAVLTVMLDAAKVRGHAVRISAMARCPDGYSQLPKDLWAAPQIVLNSGLTGKRPDSSDERIPPTRKDWVHLVHMRSIPADAQEVSVMLRIPLVDAEVFFDDLVIELDPNPNNAPPKFAAPVADVTNSTWISRDATYTVSSMAPDTGGKPKPSLLSGVGGGYTGYGGVDHDWEFTFHTREEPDPFIVIDLSKVFEIDSLEIVNRKGDPKFHDRAKTITAWSGSTKDGPWDEFWRAQGGSADWLAKPAKSISARFIKLGLRGQGIFHLHSVKVFGKPAATPRPTVVPADAVAFSGHHYRVFLKKTTWADAKARCEEMGGHLACIETKEEQDFITSQLQSITDNTALFIGATDTEREGDWRWVNGQPLSFKNWAGNQPNGGIRENWMAIWARSGGWSDTEGTEPPEPRGGFICEWDGAGAAPVAAKKKIDLMKLIDLQKDQIKGTWTKTDTSFLSDAASDMQPNSGASRLQIPYQPPEEYDFKIVFTRVAGQHCAGQIFPARGMQLACIYGGYANSVSGFELVNGDDAHGPRNTSAVRKQIWRPGQKHTALIEVRRDGAKAYFDGELLTQTPASYDGMGTPAWYALPDSKCLGITSFASPTAFHEIEVTEIRGRGTFTRPKDPAAIDADKKRGTAAVEVPPQNALVFEDFEKFDLANTPGLKLSTPTDLSIVDEPGRGKVLRINHSGTGTAEVIYYLAAAKVAGRTIRYSAWVKCPKGFPPRPPNDNAGPKLLLRFNDASTKQRYSEVNIKPLETDWHRISNQIALPPEVKNILLGIRVQDATADVLFDDFTIEVDPAKP